MDVDKMQKELAVWTQDPGLKVDNVYNLIYDRGWLLRALGVVRSNLGLKTAGVNRQSVSDFEGKLEENTEVLARRLKP